MSNPRELTANELIHGGQGLVRMLALRLHRRFHERFELDDLIAFGQVGLAQAAAAFESSQGQQFSTYAYYRVRGSIYEGIEKMGWGTRSMHRRSRFHRRAHDLLEYAVDPPSLPETTLEADAQWLGGMTQQLVVVSLATIDGGDDSSTATEDTDPQDVIAAREIHEHLKRLVAALPEEPRRLIESMYFEGRSLQEAAGELKISKSWASRLHGRALARLASELRCIGVEGPAPESTTT
jgi:RNA polymerase sigma factor for flagellar operon FliA